MATKRFVKINGNLLDVWEMKSLKKEQRYNPIKEKMDYLIVVNRGAIQTNQNDWEEAFETEELRDERYKDILERLEFDMDEFVDIV